MKNMPYPSCNAKFRSDKRTTFFKVKKALISKSDLIFSEDVSVFRDAVENAVVDDAEGT